MLGEDGVACVGDAVGIGHIAEAAAPVGVAADIDDNETGAEKAAAAAAALELVVDVGPAVPGMASEQIAIGKEYLLAQHLA